MKLQKVKASILAVLESKGINDEIDEKLDKAIDLLFEAEWLINNKIDEELDDATGRV